MANFVNHVTVAAPRNGTNSHTVDPSSGVAVAGVPFTPTAGSLLVCIAGGSVTSSTPAGWTLATQAVNNSGLYLWHRVAAGGDVLTTDHNGTNFPAVFDFYEFLPGSAFLGSAAEGNVAATGGAVGPSLAGLTDAANFRAAAACQGFSSGPDPTYTWSNGTEAVDTFAMWAAEGGYGYSLSYLEDQVDATYSSAATSTLTFGGVERLVFAVSAEVAAGEVFPVSGSVEIVSGVQGSAALVAQVSGSVNAESSVSGAVSSILGVSGSVDIVSTVSGSVELATPEEPSMAEPPCNWPASYAGCPGGARPQVLASLPASGQAIFEQMAAEYLWNWTGRSYGVCEVTVEPCRQDCLQGISTFNGSGPFNTPLGPFNSPWTPVLIDGLWFNVGCGRCGDKCGCDGKAPLKLPGPIQSVAEVSIDGVVLDPMAYYVNNHALLVRADGSSWPECGLKITYDKGSPVPIGGQIAAGVLAAEFAKAACNDKSCALPQRVQSITRQGVTIAVLDSFDDVDTGHTGIFIIDSWIASVTKIPTRSHVLSPDKPRSPFRRKTWPLT